MSLTSIHNTLDEDLPIPSSPDCPVMSSAPVIFAGVVMPKNELLPIEIYRQQILFLIDGLSRDRVFPCIVLSSKLPPSGGNFLLGK